MTSRPMTSRVAGEPRTVETSRRDERGAASALTLMLGVGLIVLPVMVLVLTLPAWEQRAVDAQDVARTAARALAVSSNWQQGEVSANQAIAEIEAGDGLPPSDVSVSYAGSLDPGSAITVSVSVAIPAGNLPGLGFVGTLHYSATSTEHVDSYGSYESGGT